MKKLITLFMLAGILFAPVISQAQDTTETAEETAVQPSAPASTPVLVDDDIVAEEQGFHQVLKEKFIEGGVTFMTPILICLILGLAVALERIITFNLSATNSKKLLAKVEDALETGGIEAAKRSEEHTSELQSRPHIVCRLLLEKKK